MTLREYVRSITGSLAVLEALSGIYGFSLALIDNVEIGFQGLPLDIAQAIASNLGVPLSDVVSNVSLLAPPGVAQRKARVRPTVQLLNPDGSLPKVQDLTISTLRIKPTVETVLVEGVGPERPS